MFSGIKYIFGYTEETVSPTVSDAAASPSVPQHNNDASSGLTETVSTTKLEQTLNAATTKFTEQLLPQQASIEQLQSSSHQLLPSIIEQHEEEELKKKSSIGDETSIEAACDADDEDGFNVESWELLDLVENKAEDDALTPASLISSVQKDETLSRGSSCKSTSGILKNTTTTSDTNDNGTSHTRQKAKVSFEESDLVILNEIEQLDVATEKVPGSGSSKAGAEKAKSKAAANGVANCEKVPILNYAKALSTKPASRAQAPEKLSEKILAEPLAGSSRSVVEKGANGGPVKRNRPARVSTSSWSSHDDEDDIEQVHKDDWEIPSREESADKARARAQEVDAEDNESIVSSGFSDCDYGFGGINDYVMRPKKANAKRGRTVSGNLGSTSGAKSSRPERKLAIAKAKLASTVEARSEGGSRSSGSAKEEKSEAPPRNSKPKKKRMIMSTSSKSVNLSDFLKYRPGGSKEAGQHQQEARKKTNSSAAKQAAARREGGGGGGSGSTESSDVADMDESWFVTPPSCFTGAAKRNDNGKVDSPKTREADRENALIEHPSVYIANAASKGPAAVKSNPVSGTSGVKRVQVAPAKASDPVGASLITFEDESWNSGDESDEFDVKHDDVLSCRSANVHKLLETKERELQFAVMAHQQPSAKAQQSKPDPTPFLPVTNTKAKSTANKKSSKQSPKLKAKANSGVVAMTKPSESKAWRNKFIVDAWDLDENDDADSDFDNMFESNKKRKSSSKPKKQPQKHAKVRKAAIADLPHELASFEDETSSSVELLSVKSLGSQEFENDENSAPSPSSSGLEVGKQQQQAPEETKQTPPSPAPKGSVENRRPPTQVRPLEPERVPGWQLKRQRSKRRPLAAAAPSVVNKQPQQQTLASSSPSSRASKTKDESLSSANSSSRSTPTLIDRIGCSIVTNLTNLTNGLVSSGAMNCCPPSGRSTLMEGQEKAIGNKPNSSHNAAAAHVARKQLSRGSIRRQNICAKQGNSLRRPDRRLKLFSTPNGCSVNRKVHTSIH